MLIFGVVYHLQLSKAYPGIPFHPQTERVPTHKLLVIRVWGMFQGYVGIFLDTVDS